MPVPARFAAMAQWSWRLDGGMRLGAAAEPFDHLAGFVDDHGLVGPEQWHQIDSIFPHAGKRLVTRDVTRFPVSQEKLNAVAHIPSSKSKHTAAVTKSAGLLKFKALGC
jgi:hypothetical protein